MHARLKISDSQGAYIRGNHVLTSVELFRCGYPPSALFSAHAETAVGSVSKVQNAAQVGTTAATVGTPVHMNDRLRTGANARLEVTFIDNSSLTLGEKCERCDRPLCIQS